jgi:hypothetical protein
VTVVAFDLTRHAGHNHAEPHEIPARRFRVKSVKQPHALAVTALGTRTIGQCYASSAMSGPPKVYLED